jgi:hypothetical protein
MMRTYADLVDTRTAYAATSSHLGPVEAAAVIHATQHSLAKMDMVRCNNDRIEAEAMEAADAQDQGFVRPTVLLLAPTRSVAFAAVTALLHLLRRDSRCVLVSFGLSARDAGIVLQIPC